MGYSISWYSTSTEDGEYEFWVVGYGSIGGMVVNNVAAASGKGTSFLYSVLCPLSFVRHDHDHD
jgi:hypothetical protein